ncbi:hypothetical protein [Cumulibacter manganitolerans]|uniref:hypothetical protein n=1 Tax=Cumulibacter manganitolerans TaxID=1884992 RepID=UPI00129497C8|nr:hypothetical protein [Cumulibacter manganitolerans]
MATTTETPTHLLTPRRIDQLVIEHYDPAGYPGYPAELIAEYEASCAQVEELATTGGRLTDAGLTIVEQPEHPQLSAHLARVTALDERMRALEGQITRQLTQRREHLDQLYRALPPVAAERQQPHTARYLGAQQWLLHVSAACADVRRNDQRANILAVAAALAAHARSDGIFLAGVVEVQAAAGIAHSTWTRAYTWLARRGLAATLHPARPLTLLERALAVGTEKHAHVRRWRAVIQLQHASARVCRPAKWVPPSRRLGTALPLCKENGSTDLRPVDNGASRRTAAPSSRPTTTRRTRRRWRQFDAATSVLWKRLQLLAERQTRTYLGNHPDVRALGSQIDAQRAAIIGCLMRCSPLRVMPHLARFAAADIEPASLIAAIEAAEYRAGRDPARRTWNADRRLIAALTAVQLDDVLIPAREQEQRTRMGTANADSRGRHANEGSR